MLKNKNHRNTWKDGFKARNPKPCRSSKVHPEMVHKELAKARNHGWVGSQLELRKKKKKKEEGPEKQGQTRGGSREERTNSFSE